MMQPVVTPPTADARVRDRHRWSWRWLLGISGRRVGLARLNVDEIAQREVRLLASIASGERYPWRFPAALETAFQQFVRESSVSARLNISLLTMLAFATAPLWLPLVLGHGSEVRQGLVLALIFGMLVPVFLANAYIQYRYVRTAWSEWVMLTAFALETALIEFLRHRSELAGHPLNPSMALLVPLAVVSLTRIRLSRVALFFAGYVATVIALAAYFAPLGARKEASTWLLEALVLGVALASTGWATVAARRQWAAMLTLRLMAFRDALTGLANRRALDDHYESATRALRREGRPTLVLALIDIDHFKRINDRYGHAYGDGVLSELGVALSQFARRPLDLAARVGGEEFALVLYDCSARDGLERTQALCTLVREMGIENQDAPAGVVTCSIGVATVTASTALSEAYRLADEALYRAKRQGRDQVVPADNPG
ncbi:GGDEF domain-containing protein [Flagellatimonas centrodinii]|uniref:GGDEF domain-containing protein n=1 Tax=Flagellatimonas centrodinii TaxID=2806210 RepID=UPI001EFAA34F|nr:GGDEF domain-containing protein [Flagellatimonas centrodinii]ULQ46755.1 GGDEF domain-containing protein [Flagellatimonas centrodinii]